MISRTNVAEKEGMTTTACFMIVSKNDIPIYEAEVGAPPRVSSFLSSLSSLIEASISGNYRKFQYFLFLFWLGEWGIEFNRLTWYGNFLLLSFFSIERGSCASTPIYITFCVGYCSGSSLDYQCYVSPFHPLIHMVNPC